MKDHLIEIESKYLPDLKKLYALDESKSYTAFTTIDYYIRCFEQDPSVKHIKIFCLNGDFSDGTFVVTDRCIAFADTSSESYDRLNRLLQLIDYSKGYIITGIRSEIAPVIRNVLHSVNAGITMDEATLLYFLPKEEALKLSVLAPQDIQLRPLTELHDLEKANSVWSVRDQNSLAFFQRITKFNPSVGAFKYDGTLVAWAMQFPIGLIAALQTDERYHGNGYGALVMKYISKRIAEMGYDVYADIFESNLPSRSLFEKHGFKPIGRMFSIGTKITWTPADE